MERVLDASGIKPTKGVDVMQKIFFYFGDFGILVDAFLMTRGETVNQFVPTRYILSL